MKEGRRWSARLEEAAVLVARDELSDEAIATAMGITRHGLQKWKRRPEFQARVAEITIAIAEAIRGKGIAEVENRVAALNDRWGRMRRVIEARAERYGGVPGGETGLLVPQVRVVRGRGTTATRRHGDAETRGTGDGERQVGLWDGEEVEWGSASGRGDAETRRRGEGEGAGRAEGWGLRTEDGGVEEVVEFVVDVALLREMREHEKQAAQELGQWQAERESEATVVVRQYVGVDVEKV